VVKTHIKSSWGLRGPYHTLPINGLVTLRQFESLLPVFETINPLCWNDVSAWMCAIRKPMEGAACWFGHALDFMSRCWLLAPCCFSLTLSSVSFPRLKPSLLIPSVTLPHLFRTSMAAHGNTASFVRIFIECHNLLDKDTFSKSDPFCCLRLKNSSQPSFQEIGRTEVRNSSDRSQPQYIYFIYTSIQHFAPAVAIISTLATKRCILAFHLEECLTSHCRFR
jgi:hypothetical protein